MRIRKVNVIDVNEWNYLVEQTYRRPYNFQQQDGCKDRGLFYITIPNNDWGENYENDTIPEVVNGDEIGVSFKGWLERDPSKKLNTKDDWVRENGLGFFWNRSFYPDIQMVANDLHEKGLIEAGEYCIEIDW